MSNDPFRFDGKRALVVGGATGMGAAAADLLVTMGADVVVMDYAPVERTDVTAISVNLADRDSIDAALDACGGPIHALLSCAGIADGPAVMKVNFIGHRHLIDRAISAGMMPRGSSIGMISSAAGLGWERELTRINEFLDTAGFDEAVAWTDANPDTNHYMWAKQVMCTYVGRQAYPFISQGIRINAIVPGPTDTPLARANSDTWLGFGADYRADAGIEPSTSEEQAGPLVFLCSDAARHVNGALLITDAGYMASGLTGSYPAATGAANFLYGRY